MKRETFSYLTMKVLSVFITLSFLAVSVQTQTIEEEFNNPCTIAKSCGQCIQISPICAWCGDKEYPRGESRCDIMKNIKLKSCKDVSNPITKGTIGEDKMWTSGDANNPPVQVKPQTMEFNIRTNNPLRFNLSFQQQANYPVDLYFLLDLTYGMVRQKEAQQRLIALGNDIHQVMAGITNNFRIGFGTFVDKNLMPYSPWTARMLKDRCPFVNKECTDPHDYKHQMDIGNDTEGFSVKMSAILEYVSQSLDDAEGGLDGLIQALECDKIGWRDVSRRIIVYSSNSLFHLAGNGKLGGATKQSDLKCSLRPDNTYADEKIFDYPSVSQLASKMKDKNGNVIFAVMSDVVDHYHQLKGYLPGAVVGELEDDSKNIVKLISDKYYELKSKIHFEANDADHVNVKFMSKCLGDVLRETAICENLQIKDGVNFEVTLTVEKEICDGKTGIVKKIIVLDAVGLKEQLTITLNVMCGCECESELKEVLDSPDCSEGNGTLECGMCSCNPGRYGVLCECDASQISTQESLDQCRMDFETRNDTLVCSGNGECICGVCNCFPIPLVPGQTYKGDYCQCNDFSCPEAENGLMCGGSTNGRCVCGKCSCNGDWTGFDCSCNSNRNTCKAKNGEECNLVGECNCGKCTCFTNGTTQWLGPTCEDCLTCSQCSEYSGCAKCHVGVLGLTEDCEKQCPNVKKLDTLPEGDGIWECNEIDVDGCTFYFTYQYTPDNDVLIFAQNTKMCPKEAPVYAIVGGTVAAVVLIPLLIICLIIFIRNKRDAKEFADFMKEREKARWDSGANPIYKDPQSTFKNPMYKGEKSC